MDQALDNNTVSIESPQNWEFFGKHIPKGELTYFSQIIIIYIVIVSCILNLSLKNGDSNLWTALLSSSIGYILPAPKITKRK